jgi:hypothetical protein
MVASSALIAPMSETKSSSSLSSLFPRTDSNASSSGIHSDASRSFGHDEISSDSLSSPTSSSHYVIKCNVNPTMPSSVSTITPRVKVTVQQPSITGRTSRFDSITTCQKNTLLPLYLKAPQPVMITSTASSAPEFSLSGASSVDDSDELTSYEQYKSSTNTRESNPSSERRKNSFDDWTRLEQCHLPRSKSEINTLPIDPLQSSLSTSQIKPVNNRCLTHYFSC